MIIIFNHYEKIKKMLLKNLHLKLLDMYEGQSIPLFLLSSFILSSTLIS